jgi:hypothetical protein
MWLMRIRSSSAVQGPLFNPIFSQHGALTIFISQSWLKERKEWLALYKETKEPKCTKYEARQRATRLYIAWQKHAGIYNILQKYRWMSPKLRYRWMSPKHTPSIFFQKANPPAISRKSLAPSLITLRWGAPLDYPTGQMQTWSFASNG